ncbi:P-loop containing nucleoside triphosphate hydrolase protein [Penicillium atrosanguineum]|uniref:P-loop containing nucleoside triphosphate hydrolase protein n=1 Tax=Penicillium atrosanguineum TaxID=1132637 RepID=A0A9W9PLA3_9EURO|nr:P-loop containing nucleoside triphosphate hydrolase protein [Penicillium atrosanguineum]
MSSITSQQDEARPEALNPLAPVIYGLLVSVFNGFENGTVEASELRSKVATFSLYYVYLSIALFVFTYVATVGFYYSGDRIARALRTAYLSAILRQNMAFFDTQAQERSGVGSCRTWGPCSRRLRVNWR